MAQTLPADFMSRMNASFPEDFVTRDPAELTEYGRDWTRVHEPRPSAVVFPRSTDQVSRLMELCSEHRVPVVPSGGRTGLAAGAVATDGELVVSLSRMRRMEPVDELGMCVRVQAGAVTQAVHQHCSPLGLTWPIDFASKGSSHVGGNIATNAGGVRVIRHGLTRQWVLGLQVVMANGDVLELNGALEKNNTGFDLRQLFIGTEGTLGIITEATLKLTRLPGRSEVMLFALTDVPAVLTLFRHARRGPFVINAFEFFTREGLARVQRHRSLHSPFAENHPCYVLLEVEAARTDCVEAWAEQVFEQTLVVDGTLAQSSRQAEELWALREGISESLSATGVPHKNDVALPISALHPFCAELRDVFERQYKGWEVVLFGHVGDGNLHINIMKPDDLGTNEFLARTSQADRDLFSLVRKYKGSISAEHGIGLLKKPYLSFSRTPEELALFRAFKKTLDPLNLLNPGKILDVS